MKSMMRGGACLLLLNVIGCTTASDMHVGQQLPAVVAQHLDSDEMEGPTLVWVFRTEDCFKCQQFFPPLRNAQRRQANVPLFVAMHRGEERDVADIERTISRERIAFDMKRLSEEDATLLEEMGLTFPMLFAIRRTLIVGLSIADATARGSSDIKDLLNAPARW